MRLDVLCEILDGTLVCVEIEKNKLHDKQDHQKRVRVISSNITMEYFAEGKSYDYANAEYEDDTNESKLMQYLTCNNPLEEQQNKNYIKIEDVREDRKMSPEFEKLMKDLREEGREEGVFNTLASLVKKGLINIKDAAIQANMTEKEFTELLLA